MGAVAVERAAPRVGADDHVDEGSAAEQRVTAGPVPSKLEGLLLRYLAWGSERPHNALARAQHKLAMTLFRLGYGRFDDDMVLTTTGRTSGQPRHVVVGAMLFHDRLYVANPFGDRAHWYRNLLVDPIVTLQRRGRTWTARATRIVDHDEAVMLYEETPGAAGHLLRLFLRAEGIAETAEDFARNIDRFCFVRFDEVSASGPPPMKADLVWVWPVAGVTAVAAWLARRRLRAAIATAALSVRMPRVRSMAVTVVAAALALRRSGVWERLTSWGVDPTSSMSALPGDELVVDPTAIDTRCLEVAAPPSAIWPWLVQMGDDRGGEYSYSVFGWPHRKGADRIVPEWQDLAVGDRLNEWVVQGLEPERTLILYSDIAGSWSWVFVLEPLEGGRRTRFVERIRSHPALPRPVGAAAMRVMGLVMLLMVRKQMLTIRERAEGPAV